MKLKQLLPSLLLLIFSSAAFAQSENPFASIGKKGKVLTLTKGQYDETFDADSIQQIGSSLINVRSMKLVKLLGDDESKIRLEGEKHSRFLSTDPLTRSYPMLTPYQYASNTPTSGIDIDGLEFVYFDAVKRDERNGVTKFKVTNVLQTSNVNYSMDVNIVNKTNGDVLYKLATLSVSMEQLGIQKNVVSVDGKTWRVLPDNFSLDNLPHPQSTIWQGLETNEEYGDRIKNNLQTIVNTIQVGSAAATSLTVFGSYVKGKFLLSSAAAIINPTKIISAAKTAWKGFSKGKLGEHFTKHGAEFAANSAPEYLKMAKNFAKKEGEGIQEVIEGNFLIKYEKSSGNVLIGHLKDREIRTFYSADPSKTVVDPLTDAINLAKELGGKK